MRSRSGSAMSCSADRPPRHTLEVQHPAARRLCQIRRGHERGQRSRSGVAGTPGCRARPDLASAPGVAARDRRGGRPGHQLCHRNPDPRRVRDDIRGRSHAVGGGAGQPGKRCGARRLAAGGSHYRAERPRNRDLPGRFPIHRPASGRSGADRLSSQRCRSDAADHARRCDRARPLRQRIQEGPAGDRTDRAGRRAGSESSKRRWSV